MSKRNENRPGYEKTPQLINPYSSGGGGNNFETRVQAAFVVLMLIGGFVPCIPTSPIKKIKLQGKYKGFDTDDLIIYTKSLDGNKERKLLSQIKHSISITEGDKVFGDVIQAAWSDFKNPKIFTEGSDAIGLITGPLSTTDINDVRTILEWARNSENAVDFLTKVNQTNFSSDVKRKKLKVFQKHLKNANGDEAILDNDLWRFMKSFYLLGYDLDIKSGVTLSLLLSLICQYSSESTHSLWSQIVDEVQLVNQNAGTITVDSLPEELRSAFQRRTVKTFPVDLALTPSTQETTDWSKINYASELAIACLLGAWNEKSEGDKVIAGQLANEDFAVWLSKIRGILQKPESPIILKNGKWTITKRLDLWQVIGPRLFDEQLERFKQCVVNVLKERDPKFDLPPEERYAACIHGKVSRYSESLRKGFAESLALLGSNSQALKFCSAGKADTIAVLAIREIFEKADWVLWGSLNNLLPLLAEATPNQFLNGVEDALKSEVCPFNDLFAQEGNGITGANYITGLLWALETLAWDEQYLSRVTVILGELAVLDPGGNWMNRPANSLTTIFLPWFPQTTASVEKRKVAIQTLQKELPDIAWKLLISLLPHQHQMSDGSHKPTWRRTIPENLPKRVTQKEYWDQVSFYADITIDAAKVDLCKLTELVKHIDNLPQPTFDRFLIYLESNEITGKPEQDRLPLWNKLVDFVSKHKRYADAKWALSSKLVDKISKITDCLAPQNPMNFYQRLFSNRNDDLYEENGNWEEQERKLEERRQNAVRNILKRYGLKAVIEFAENVEYPLYVGLSLGFVAEDNIDLEILPKLLDSRNDKRAQFTSGFICGRYQHQGWAWVDKTNTSDWSTTQIVQFLINLPFTDETWKRSKQHLVDHVAEYWRKAAVNPYQVEGRLEEAVDKLMEYNRPNAALSCIYRILHNKQPLDQTRTIMALLAAVSSAETDYPMDMYHTVEIIKALQNDPKTNPDDLFRVEWAYLRILNQQNNASPKLLEQRLASEPEFFCEVIRAIFRSKNEEKPAKEPTEQQKNIATNAYWLLKECITLPGIQSNGTFDDNSFNNWLSAVKVICKESGHLEVALLKIGNILIHTPPDPDGLWIHHSVANALNAKDAEEMRNGFSTGIFNSRGVYCVDPTGKPEKELADKYRQQAEEVENHGYQRFAATLRELADSYERDAEQIINKYKSGGENEK